MAKELTEQDKSVLYAKYKKLVYGWLCDKRKSQGRVADDILAMVKPLGHEQAHIFMVALLMMCQQRAIEINTQMIQDQAKSFMKKSGIFGMLNGGS